MLTRLMQRLFPDRLAPGRFVLVIVLVLADLRLQHQPVHAWDWTLALAGLAVCLAGSVLPLTASITLPAVLVLGDLTGAHMSVPLKAMITVALFDLALRAPARRVAAGAAATGALLIFHAWYGDSAEFWPAVFRLAVLTGVPLVLGGYVRVMRENARQARALAAEQERLRRSEILAARTAIARELHDLVAHHVSSMVLRAGVARHVLAGADPRVAGVLDDLHGSGAAALADLRRLVTVLRDPSQVDDEVLVPPADLPTALWDVVEHARHAGIEVRAEIDPAITGLDAMRGLTVLRLSQEGLANVIKHAGPAATARFHVARDGDTIRLEITDDGGGRPVPARSSTSDGHGLLGMTERVTLLDGRLDAGPAPNGRGWSLLAELPVSAAPEPVAVEHR